MPKSMRLIDAGPIEAELERLRGIAERRGDARAAATLAHIAALIEDAPEILIRPDEDKMKRKKYGKYKNVLLSESELDTLKDEFPETWQSWIEEVSEGVAKSGKKYKNFVAVIRNWARREAEKKKTENTALSSFETEDVLTAAMARTRSPLSVYSTV